LSRLHSHPCARCKRPFACGGDWLRNHDGHPEAVCEFFHVSGETHPIFRECEDCTLTHWCQFCGAQPVTVYVEGDGLCAHCAAPAGATA
jgi:hypothetical protein